MTTFAWVYLAGAVPAFIVGAVNGYREYRRKGWRPDHTLVGLSAFGFAAVWPVPLAFWPLLLVARAIARRLPYGA